MALVNAVFGKGWMEFPVTGQAAHTNDAAGSLGYVENPEDEPIIITRCVLYGITNSTGVANITVGTAATVAAAHDVANIFTAAAQAASAGTAKQGLACGDPADVLPVVASGEVIAAFGSATTVGYTGRCHIDYIHA